MHVLVHESEQLLSDHTNRSAVTTDIRQYYTREYTVIAYGQVMDVATVLPELQRRRIDPSLQPREVHRMCNVVIRRPHFATRERVLRGDVRH